MRACAVSRFVEVPHRLPVFGHQQVLNPSIVSRLDDVVYSRRGCFAALFVLLFQNCLNLGLVHLIEAMQRASMHFAALEPIRGSTDTLGARVHPSVYAAVNSEF